MEYWVGSLVALSVAGLAAIVGLDRERAFYPTVLIVIASYYPLFGVMGGSRQILGIEITFGAGFLLLAIVGFKKNLWLVAAAMVGHGVFDCVHHFLIANSGVPRWWPGFCLAFDVVAGGWVALLLITRRRPATR